MRLSRVALTALAVACLFGAQGAASSVPSKKSSKKARTKSRSAASPALAGGMRPAVDVGRADLPDTVTTFQNELGQTVYSIAASRFDISPPLSTLALRRIPGGAGEEVEPENPQLPEWLAPRSDIPDPVVQIAPSGGGGKGFAPLSPVPTTGFNFLGVGIVSGTPSDSNGSVGDTQFVETVNFRYQVWNLNRSTKVATSVLGPTNTNTLWSGFGGACQAQNSGDPIVVYDKVANRWLISQFTSTASSGVYYQCVAVSTTSNATGTYARWAFAVPGGSFGDYPHFGVWSDAYYMMGHAFTSSAGSYVAAMFAAMDRTKMLAGDPTATWQVIMDPSEGGHMPADLDGFAPPPTKAPGVFLSLHSSTMFLYRMKVDFVTPANTVKTLQATVPVAPAAGACNGGGSCIPQPGTSTTVSSLGDRLMFRAGYRNLVDHESIVVSHSVDPSVSGVVSGVRWYDLRLSGTPDATCPTYPCMFQQGTIADVANGRSRWMPSIAMDTAENILVAYSTTGKTAGTENHSIRYTGRVKADPPGTMSVPETTIVTGTANNTNNRWGDYASMSVDPTDDCSFFYVGQYFTSAGNWSTRVASATWPTGTCAPTSCTSRPAVAPAIGTATVPGDNQITVTWSPIVPTPGAYAIERADGVCGSEGLYRPLASVAGTTTSFTDTTVLGGLNYSYRVIASTDAAGKCQALVASGCVSAVATGTCNLKPAFAGAAAGDSSQQSNCGVTLSWAPASSSCPLTPNVRYSIFRGTVPDFVPSIANRIATCVSGPSSYTDRDNVASGTTYYYVVRAEDDSTGNSGECGGGNEESNGIVVPGTAYGAGTQAAPGTWTDGGGDGTAFLQLNVAGPGDTSDKPWRYVKTANDAGANHTPGGAYAYRNAGPGAGNIYGSNVCAEMQSPPLTAAAPSMSLQYWERHQIEYHWDAIAVEYSVNGGPWNDIAAPSNAPADGCDPADAITDWQQITCTQAPPINGCGYPTTKFGFNGPLAGGTSCNDWATAATTGYAHRCHPVTGLTPGDGVRFRWRFASDPGAEFAGFYLDDVAVTNVRLPNTCAPDTCAGQSNGTACDDGDACTTGESCGGGICQPGVPSLSEIAGVSVQGHASTTIAWTALGGSAVYDVASATVSSLRTSGTSAAACIADNLASPSVVDTRADPAAGDGYYYLIRAQSGCGSGGYGFDSGGLPRTPVPGCP